MGLIQLDIQGISYSQTQDGAYALILEEREGNQKLPIIIGNYEAQAIAIALEQELSPSRPLTHDLFVSFATKTKTKLTSIRIHKLEEGIFYSFLCFTNPQNEIIEIDSRTSDAIALALRFNAPMFTTQEIMDKAGIEINMEEEHQDEKTVEEAVWEIENELESSPEDTKSTNEWTSKTNEEIAYKIEQAITEENYELAAELRDELERRK